MSVSEVESFELRHGPQTIRQVESCVDPGDHHAVHRRFTGLVNYVCNCGYSSGWVLENGVPTPSEFIAEHAPTEDVRIMAELGSA